MFILFISIVVTVYGLLNYYFIKKHRNIINTRSLTIIFIELLIFTIMLTPVAAGFVNAYQIQTLSYGINLIGYSWLAFLFLFLSIHGFFDLILFLIEKVRKFPPPFAAKGIFVATISCCLIVILYGRHEAHNIQTERIILKTDKLPASVKKLTIVQLTDIHFGPTTSAQTAEIILHITNQVKPDIIFSTGDLLDRNIQEKEQTIKTMQKLQAPLGKYAIAGNHEFISGIDKSENFIQKIGFTLLRNRSVSISNTVNIIGIDDISAKRFIDTTDTDETSLFKGLPRNLYTIFLKHQPRVENNSTAFFDLQLSGHTHAGQIFPFTILVKLVFPHIAGLYELENGAQLYVGRGTGTWGPPIRFLAPPEITVIELVNSQVI